LDSIINALHIPVTIAILLFSVIIHEVSHGLVAEKLGDPTARRQGRITLNPVPHIDLVGSIILPVAAVLMHLPLLGWAKPVPIDIRQFKDPMRDFAITALAGPVSNLAQVMVYTIIFHVAMALEWSFLVFIGYWGVYINLLLAMFNLLECRTVRLYDSHASHLHGCPEAPLRACWDTPLGDHLLDTSRDSVTRNPAHPARILMGVH